MKKAFTGLILGLCCWAAASVSQATNYALCTGLNKYNTSYVPSSSFLNGCVPDAKNVYTNITLRGEWTKANATMFTNAQGTFAAVSNKLMNFASTAVSGDVVLYYHSSHGYQDSGKNTGICMYDKDMPDSSFAKILANFKSGVKVIIVLDTCHSGGMFKSLRRDGTTRDLDTASPFTFAERVNEELAAIRADEAARGVKAAKLAVLDCAWVTAADYNQYSWDGDEGGAFTECYVGSVKSGACDKSPYGNGDSYATFKEMFDYAVEQEETHGQGAVGTEDYTMPQCTNTTILAAVRFGWVGKEEPSGVRFDPIPEQTATVGEAVSYTLKASNSDGSSGKITFSVASATAPAGSYSLDSSSGAFSFTPATDGTFSFNFVGTNATAKTSGKATMTVAAALAAPDKLSNSGITASSFTANWEAVPGAVSYVLEVVAADPDASASAKAADSAFELVTAEDGLTEGEYVILGENADTAMNNTCSGASSGYLGCTGVSVEGSAVSTDDAAIIWTLAGDASSCTLFNAAAGKFANPATSKSVGWADEASGAWTLSLSDGLVTAANEKDTSWVLQYNSSSPRFMCYSSKQKLLRFFRRDGASSAVFAGDVGNVTSYTVADLIPGDYTWRVRAIGNAKGPFSETQDVSLVADPTAPPSIRAIADDEVEVGETLYIAVKVSAPEEAPVTSLAITAGDAAAKLGEDGVFSFAPTAPGTYDFTITAVNANGSAEESFAVTATLAEPETPEAPAEVDSDSFTAAWEPIPGAESYELDVVQGATSGGGGGGGGEGGVVLTEDFSKVTTSNSTAISSFDACTQTPGWSGDTVYPAKGLVRLGKSGVAGSLQTPALEVAGSVTVKWSAYSWPKDATKVNVGVSENGGASFTETTVAITESMAEYTSTFPVSGSSAIVRWQGSSESTKQRFYLDDITVSSGAKARELSGTHVEGFPKNVGNVTSYDVTGLLPNTEYTFAFRAIAGEEATEWSAPVSVKTADGPAPAAWTAIPAQTASVGYPFSIDLSAYVSGVPTPSIALTSGTAELSGTVLSFTPAEAGEYSFTVTASNSSGDPADATFTVTAADHVPTKYAVCVGINEYADINGLEGCVNDSLYMESNLIERGGWAAENVVRLNDAKATKAAIRKAIADVAAKAQAGDTFVYQHSSHGGQFNATEDDEDPLTGEEGKATFLCVYDELYDDNTTAYNDYEIAADMAAFNAGVKVAVIVDACHSGGLFKSKEAAKAAAASFDLAGRVTAIMDADRAQRKARGENVAKTLSSSEIGWATAAEYYEYSYDGGFYHTDEWLTNNVYGDEYYNENTETYNYPSSYKQGGVFLASATWSWWNGDADADGNGYCDAHEFWQKGYDFCSVVGEFWYEDAQYNYYPQCTNVAVLKSIELGYAGTPTLDAPVAAPASGVTASSFTASWSSVADATGYRVQVASDGSFSTGASTDTLTADDFAATSTTYTEFSGVAKDSGAVYAGKSAKNGTGAIQLNTGKDAGIWTTASGGNATRVAVVWNGATTTSKPRSLMVYGSAAALDSAAAVKAATHLGTIVYGTDTALDIVGTFAYVGILPDGGALYLDSVSVDWGTAGSGSTIVFDQEVGNVTSFEVTGLEAETDYWYRVQALGDPVDSDFSNVIGLTTEAGTPTAPAWDTIPPQTAVAGQDLVVDLNPYVSGSPKPAITADAGTVEAGVLTVSFAEAGEYTINLTASNSEGDASATLKVTVTAAPVTVPVLTLSNATDSTFDADWTACTGASEYQFQVASDDQFTPGGGGGGSADVTETFANATFSTTSSSYTNQTITGCDLGTWTATSCRGDSTSPIVRYAGTLTSPSLAGGVAAVEFDYEWPYKESGTCDIDLYVNGTKVGSATVTGGEAGTASYNGFTAVSGPATIEFLNTGTSNKRMQITQVRITSASRTAAKDGGSLLLDTTTNGISLTVTGLEPDTTYYARVRMAEGEWSAVESITTTGEAPAGPAKYAVCVGLSEYDMAAFAEMGLEVTPLKGCVNDATYLKKNLTERGGWDEGNVSLLTNGSATKSAIRGAIAAAAAKAKAGDTFVYEHSSHGLQGDEEDDYTVALATYDSLYEDAELAEDLASFADGVKVVVLVDACHSGGLFDDGTDAGTDGKARSAASFDIAARVSALIDANRAARKARGEDVSRTLTADQIGWVTAASYEESSKDGGYYDTDAWMSDDEAEGEERGGAFLAALAWGWWSAKADVSGEGDGDGWFDAYEGWSFSTPVCAEYDQTPQYLNEDVLRSVELGWVGDTAPTEALVFDPVPGAEVAIGEEATLAVVAKNADGTTDGITLSIVATDPEGLVYTFADGTLAFTPAEDGLFLFTVQAVKGRLSATKILGVTAVLPAPVAQEVEAAEISEDGFTARWLGVDAARNYQIQVSTDPDFPMGEPEQLIEEGFDGVTNKASLPEGWEFTGTFGTYASGGEAAPSIKLSTDKAVLATPSFELTGAENGLAFWAKGYKSGSDMTSTLTVEQLVGEEWLPLEGGTFVPSTDGETKQIEGLDPGATRIRFVMAKLSGNIAIDDVMVAQANGGPVVDDDEIPADSTSYEVEDLEPGTTYYFRVRAIANTKSAWSDVIEVTTAGEKPIPVPDLTVMAPETSADTSLAAFWVCTGAEEFRLQVATDEAFATLVFDETMTVIAKTVTGLTPETTYYVRVCALDGERAGDWSNVGNITTAASGGDVPVESDIESVAIDPANGTLSFTVPEGATVMTTTDLVNGPWVAYEGEWPIPMTDGAAFFRIGTPPAGN